MTVSHILSDGGAENHNQAISRLMRMLHIGEDDLFRPREEAILDAYRKRGEAIAYEEDSDQTKQQAARL